MKLLPSLLGLSILHGALAFPSTIPAGLPDSNEISTLDGTKSDLVSTGKDLAIWSPSRGDVEERSVDLTRCLTCTYVAKALYSSYTITAARVFVVVAAAAIREYCAAYGCSIWADRVKDVFELIFALADYSGKFGSAVADSSTSKIVKLRMRDNGNSSSSLEDALWRNGYSYDALETVVLPSDGIKARDNEPALTSKYVLRSLRKGETKDGYDLAILGFAEGTGQMQLPFGRFANSTSHLGKRHTGAGVKIAFQRSEVEVTDTEYREDALSALMRQWLKYAAAGHADMFGFVEKTATMVFYYRTIVEIEGFGNNYENVNSCGALSEYLGLYLGSA